jgi:CRISPR-associated protein Cst1
VDVGIATILAHVNKDDPATLTPDDLEQVTTYIEQNYPHPPLRGHLTMAFTSNAWFVQDAYNPNKPGLSPEEITKRRSVFHDWSSRHLRQWQLEAVKSSDEQCVFTGLPAVATTLSGKLRDSRVARAQMPLLQGDEAINFFAYGESGLPISGVALLAMQFFPLGCAKCGVGLLAVHSDNLELTSVFARRFYQANSHNITLARQAGENKLISAPQSPRTMLIETLLTVERERLFQEKRSQPSSITAYNFNNGKSPSLEIYHLPFEIIGFLRQVQTPDYADAWKRIVARHWEQQKKQKPAGKRARQDDSSSVSRRNYLYEDLFMLPADAARFLRRYLLHVPRLHWNASDQEAPSFAHWLETEGELISWSLTRLFLERVMHMDKNRLESIRAMADKLADYIASQNDRRLMREFLYGDNTWKGYQALRHRLIGAEWGESRRGKLLFTLDEFLDVFADDNNPYWWTLARDMVLIRIIERLYEKQHITAFSDIETPATVDDDAEVGMV